ncbi:type 1 glutamine amidotransferase domain-containing protein [Nocardia arizonensis]|uniref:type 1 glutamine amidotransferase domain-containing protein n=1 Tax=Nocardia arizonensis TaxID=1141647 RepID=UPI0006D12850|nr:type 1 glutamine amidotransferase domain-containing protein [Nocardia arizonensis]
MSKILFVITGVDHWTLADGTKHPTGYWAEEVATPYETFTDAGYEIVVATPDGVVPTVDRASLASEVNGGPAGAVRVAETLKSATELTRPRRLDEVDLDDYVAVYYPGGHGPMEDLSEDADSAALLKAALASGKPLGVVCHAPAALLATADADGDSPFVGYRVAAFTNAEEAQSGFADKAKWLLQDRLTAMGLDVREGAPWEPNIQVDRTLYTGQNPASAGPLSAEIVRALR